MKLGNMQPYFFPYIGYYQLVKNTDLFVFLDVVQYRKGAWMNRNRVLGLNEMPQYISVPIKKHPSDALIKDIFISDSKKWRQNILGKLTAYKKFGAPYYKEVIEMLRGVFSQEYDSFSSLAIASIQCVYDYLGLKIDYKVASDLKFDRSGITQADDWSLVISKYLKANHYINPPGGYKIFNEEKYIKSGVDISFLSAKLTQYSQGLMGHFTPSLSILDVLFFNSPSDVINMLGSDFILEKKQDLIEREL